MSKKIILFAIILIPLFLYSNVIKIENEKDVEMYLRTSDVYKSYYYSYKSADDSYKSAILGLLPSFTGQYKYSYMTKVPQMVMGLPNGTTMKISVGTQDNYELMAGLNWTLFAGGRLINSVKMAKYQKEMAKIEKDMQYASLRKQGLMMYYSILLQKEMLDFLKDTRKNLEENKNTVSEMVRSGLATQTDLERVKSGLSSVDASIMEVESGMSTLKEMLKTLLGINKEDTLIIEGKIPIRDWQGDENNVYAIKMMNYGEKMAEIMPKMVIGSVLPVINVGVMYDGKNMSAGSDSTYWYSTNIYYANVSLPLNIFKFFTDYSSAKNKVKSVKLSNDYKKNMLLNNIKSMEKNLETKKKIIEARKMSLKASKMALETARERYNKGVISHLEYMQSEMDYKNAYIQYVQSEFSYIDQLLSLEELLYNGGEK